MNRPDRNDYPHTAEGTQAFNSAFMQWQADEIVRLTAERDQYKMIAEINASTILNSRSQS